MKRRLTSLQALWTTAVFCTCSQAGYPHAPKTDIDTAQKVYNYVFDTTAVTSGVTKALIFRDRGYSFGSLQQINEYNVQSAHAIAGSAQTFELREAPLESPYWWIIQNPAGAEAFIAGLGAVVRDELEHPAHARMAETDTVLRKALRQRDLFQSYSLVMSAGERAEGAESKALASRLQSMLARLFDRTLLTEHEYADLVSFLPKFTPRGFVSEPTFSLSDNYLPDRVVAQDTSWTQIPMGETPFRHFRDYGGRSFIKIYVRAPGLTGEQIWLLWQQLYSEHGDHLHSSAVTEPAPVGMETLLVRSFGVFLKDGTYRDSLWPEEITMRQFKYPRARVDHESSDFRGTLFYQYKMSREALLQNPASLGLRRVRDDDEQFFGFFGDAPDPSNSYSDTVTTMRSNCIACHEELFYGLATIFSFERNPAPAAALTPAKDRMLAVKSAGEYQLTTNEAESLWQWLRTDGRWSGK